MHYLALNVLFSSFFILCIKWAKSRGEEIINIGALNYLSAAVLGIVMYVRSAEPLDSTAAVLGAVNGGCYFVAFFFLIAAISWKGATNLAAVSRLSILMPVAFGVAWLGERPDSWQVIGIVLACLSLLMISGRKGAINNAEQPRKSAQVILMFFLIAGMARLTQEIFKYSCQPELTPLYLASGFGVAGIASLVVLGVRRKPITLSEVLIGIALGTANLLQVYFVLKSLELFDGFIVFPVTSAAGLAFTTLAAVTLLGERPSRLSYLGIAVAITALLLL